MIYSLRNLNPAIADDAFVAQSAEVIGDVALGAESSVWYGSVVRGDVHSIRIGRQTNIQDLSVVHVTGGKYPTIIGDRVTVGHRVIIHGATVQDDAFIGMGAILLDQVTVEPFGFVAAGALVTPGTIVKAGWMAIGSPARLVREIRPEEREMMIRTWKGYVTNAKLHRENLKAVPLP